MLTCYKATVKLMMSPPIFWFTAQFKIIATFYMAPWWLLIGKPVENYNIYHQKQTQH